MTDRSRTAVRRLRWIVGAYDPRREKLTAGCIGNLSGAPHCARAWLRHVWADIMRHPILGPALAAVDWDAMPRVATAEWWIGYHRGVSGAPE